MKNPAKIKFSKCSADESARIIMNLLRNDSADENAKNLVLINAAAAIFVTGKAKNLPEAFESAKESLESGRAFEKLQSLIKLTNNYA